MRPERDATAAQTPPGGTALGALVQQVVEQFVERHSAGERPDPLTFAARVPDAARGDVLARCREFLAFDGLLGHQPWADAGGAGADTKDAPGRAFGDFVIQEELGRGGMGVVYLAHQKSLNRRVALKVMASGLTLSKRHVERFRREAAAAAQLRHPAIVPVHALTEVDGTFALAMDFVAGRNLGDVLDDLRLANGEHAAAIEGTLGLAPEKGYVAECAMFGAQLASALAAAHQANVVHRDLKPRNLMIDDRRQVRLLDFGLAKSLGEGSISMSGEITGTAHYLSPEQALAKRVEVDHRADIWALGVILYEMLTLRRPFDGKNLQQIVYEICFHEPVPLQKRNPKVPRDLVTICNKALEKDPNKRYRTAAELEADLLRFLRWEPVHAKPASTTTRVLKWMRRHRTETTIAGLVVAAGLVALALDWRRGAHADELLVQAAAADDDGRYGEAYTLATQALALRNDDATRARLKSYGDARLRTKAEADSKVQSSQVCLDKDRELAMLIALDAEAQDSSSQTRSAVLAALGGGTGLPRTLPTDGADGRLVAARWSPSGARALTLAFGTATVWDPATATPVVTLRGHAPTMPAHGVFVADDRVVTAGDTTLRFWQLPQTQPYRIVQLGGTATDLHADRDGARVLVTTAVPLKPSPVLRAEDFRFVAQVHDTATGQPCSPPIEHTHSIVAKALSPCGQFAATCTGQSSGVRLWRVADGRDLRDAQAPPRGRARALGFSPDSTLLAAAVDHTVHLLRVADGAVLASVAHSREVEALAFDRKGERLLTGARDRTARLWRLERDGDRLRATEAATLLDHKGEVQHVEFDASGLLALTGTGSQAGELCVFDLGGGGATAGTAVQRLQVGPSIQAAQFAPDGRTVLAIAGAQRALLWDLRATRAVVTLRQPGWAHAVAFDATGSRLLTAGDDERLRLWSVPEGNVLWESPRLGNPLQCADVDRTGRLVACGASDGTVHLHRLADQSAAGALPAHVERVHVVRFAADGSRLLSAGARGGRGRAVLWDVDTRRALAELDRPKDVVAADLALDGRTLATVESGEVVVRLWSLPDLAPRGVLASHTDAVLSVAFAIDGQAVLTASADRSARLFALDGAVRRVFAADAPLRFAAFDRTGEHVLTGSDGRDGEVVLWRAADGSERLRFRGHRGALEHGGFSPDGAWVATAARDGTTCVWPIDPVAAARRLPLRAATAAERLRYGLRPPAPAPK